MEERIPFGVGEYRDAGGFYHEGLIMTWQEVHQLLGGPYRGWPEDHNKLIGRLLEHGAPAWIVDPYVITKVDEYGLCLIGPSV